MNLCQGLIFIWIVFYHVPLVPAASLRSEYVDTNFHGVIKSHPEHRHNGYVGRSNFKSGDSKFRPILPNERRNRPIFTSKTYFGKNQLHELPRKYWAHQEDKMISSLRGKTFRHMHSRKYVPHRSSHVALNGHKHKAEYEHQVKVPNRNFGQVYNYGPNPGHPSKEEYGVPTGYALTDKYGRNPVYATKEDYGPPNPGYATKEEYGPPNPGYATKKEYGPPNPGYATKEEYGPPNPGYATKEEYGPPNPGYATKEEYGPPNPGYATKEEYGPPNPGYATKEEYGPPNPGYATKEEYGPPNPGYATKEEYGPPNPGYATKEEYGPPNPGYATKEEYGPPNPGYATKEEYGPPNPGYATKEEYGPPNPEYATKEEYGQLNPEYGTKEEYRQTNTEYGTKDFDSKRGHGTNENGKDLGFEAESGYFINQGHDANADKELNEDNIEKKDFTNNEDNRLLLSDKDSEFFSLGNDAETSTQSITNSDFNVDENLQKDELLRNFDEEKFRKIKSSDITSNESKDTKELVEEFEGSGSVEDDINVLSISDREVNKSARIIDIFSGFNDSAECITPKNESGHCRGLTECPIIETMENFISFLQYMCRQRGLLGICCPDNPVIEVKDTDDEKSSEETKLEIEQPPDGCGLGSNTRIVGGTMSVPHEFSWMVALLRRNRFYCGGVIINNWYVLTAAHCVLGIKVSDLKVRLGEFDFQQRNDIQQDIPVMEIKRHGLFVTATFQHDIALLKLRRKIEYTKFIGSICLPNSKDEDFTKKNATVAGWGTVSFGGAASPVLRKVTVPVWDNQECDRTYVFERIDESFMCAGSSVSGEDACQGDSGGPLMSVNDDGRWEVIGIVSWGRRCGDPTFPGVYTRVTSYLDWIAENAQ